VRDEREQQWGIPLTALLSSLNLLNGRANRHCESSIALKKSNQICLPRGYYLMADTPSDSATRISLLVRVRDAEAWQTFVDTYAPLVYGYCLKRGVQDADPFTSAAPTHL
jgi:hypothetical protein